MTYSEFVASVKQMVFPDREPSNLVTNHTRFILDGLVALQKMIPQLRARNFNLFPFEDTFYRCRATVVDKPNGPIIRLFTYTKPDHCDALYYLPATRERMENLLAREQCPPEMEIPIGEIQGAPPKDVYHSEVVTDKGYRAGYGYFAVIGNQIYVWPHLDSSEHLAIEWSGIKTNYQNADVLDFDVDIQPAIELYVQFQQALREDCDLQKYAAMGVAWKGMAADLIWWYRKKELLPEQPWRDVDCCGCVSASAQGGGGTLPGTFFVYLGNAGAEEPASYTEAEILGIENTFGITKSKASLAASDYEISMPAGGENEFRVICFPASVRTGAVQFFNSGFPLPMNELPQTTINGVAYRVFRTTIQSSGTLSVAQGNPIGIVLP